MIIPGHKLLPYHDNESEFSWDKDKNIILFSYRKNWRHGIFYGISIDSNVHEEYFDIFPY